MALVVPTQRCAPRKGEGVSPHAWTVTLDHQRGGWFARCSCGWKAPRPTWYQKRSQGFAKKHVEEAERKRWGGLPLGEAP
jgi:hypothetical protein